MKYSWSEAWKEDGDTSEIFFREPGRTRQQPVLDVLEADRGVASLLSGVGQESLEVAQKRLRIVAEVSEAISQTLDESSLLTLIVKKLFEVFPQAERGFIMLPEDGEEDLHAKVALARSGQPTDIAVSRTLVRDAIENRRGILTADAMGDARFAGSDTVTSLQLRSVICVPMIARGEVFGVIHLDGAAKPFQKDEMVILAGIAQQAAVSLSNARTHARLLKQGRIEEDLALARKIQSHFEQNGGGEIVRLSRPLRPQVQIDEVSPRRLQKCPRGRASGGPNHTNAPLLPGLVQRSYEGATPVVRMKVDQHVFGFGSIFRKGAGGVRFTEYR